ncbi:sugar phosphate isomerase/epimerase family protein [Pelagicoccus mobilis]|uniref:TIM barrel protein n=1 Tax=Pelagicoccus mobilis TaxID=415221 RepID=A0A934VPV6_9BACT|nr:sugar phosphate isomerase/epimerase family protein [Pelagicoccus mobilis]MBK1877672.1 TIM barrel protein [Pelagicoccus mobilis]
MKSSICSFAFHRHFFSGIVDALKYIELSRELGVTHLHFWIVHLLKDLDMAEVRRWDWTPGSPEIPSWMNAPQDDGWAREIRQTTEGLGLEHEMLAMEKGYAHLQSPAERQKHRNFLREWIEFAGKVGIPAIRVDPGGQRDLSPLEVQNIVTSYREVVSMAKDHGVRIFVENHWGASQQPDFLNHLLDKVEGLGLLLDSWNFGSAEERSYGWASLSHRAEAVHIKTRQVDSNGIEHMYPIDDGIKQLCSNNYDGIWGIESFPQNEEEEIEAVQNTLKLIQRAVSDSS